MDRGHKAVQVWGALRGRRTRTLLYHSISDTPADPFAVHPDTFRRQMRWLAENGLHVIAHAELVRAIREDRDIPRSVVLTFDDGFVDFYHTALPILLVFGFPATLFVPAGLIGQSSRRIGTAASRELMNAEQITAACRAGIEIGSHSLSHASLTETDDADLEAELTGSLARLHEITGGKEMSLAYPYGRAGARERRAAIAAGYGSAYLAGGLWGNGRRSDPFALARELIGRETSDAGFAQMASGRADARRLLADMAGRQASELLARRPSRRTARAGAG
jgi:peptidoglycan/xylan/chitin deacetylase (PgdA/CDA1 family)